MITTEPTTVRHKIGTCPACKCGIWADLQIVTEVHEPSMRDDGTPRVYANPRLMSAQLAHLCSRADDGGWVGTDSFEDVTAAAHYGACADPKCGPCSFARARAEDDTPANPQRDEESA